jgi:hypothetical protein
MTDASPDRYPDDSLTSRAELARDRADELRGRLAELENGLPSSDQTVERAQQRAQQQVDPRDRGIPDQVITAEDHRPAQIRA